VLSTSRPIGQSDFHLLQGQLDRARSCLIPPHRTSGFQGQEKSTPETGSHGVIHGEATTMSWGIGWKLDPRLARLESIQARMASRRVGRTRRIWPCNDYPIESHSLLRIDYRSRDSERVSLPEPSFEVHVSCYQRPS
jgi:hypothetical protein